MSPTLLWSVIAAACVILWLSTAILMIVDRNLFATDRTAVWLLLFVGPPSALILGPIALGMFFGSRSQARQ